MMRRCLTAILPVILLIISGPAALAAWTSTGGSGASVTATSVSQAAQPTVEAGIGFVTISWARSTLASGDSVGGYLVLRDGVEVCTSSDTSSPTASCVDPSPVGQQVTYTVVAAIGAQWRGPASAGTPFTYDNTAPGAPSAPDLVAADDTGSSSTDNITDKSDVTVTGTAEAGSTVRIYRGTTELGSGTATSGDYSIAITLVEGSNTIHATATDAAGNISESSTTTLILSDTVTPGAPSAPDLIADDDTGPSDTDNITSRSNVTVTGTAEAGSTVRIYRGTTEVGFGTATDGSYSIAIALVEGENTLHATATDEAGNVSSSSTTTVILSDSAAPSTPGAPDLIADDDTGLSNNDNLTNKSTVTVTGAADSGSTVRIFRGTTELGSATASGGGYSITINLVSGPNDIFAKARDAAGNASADSGITTITLDTTAPDAPTTPDLIADDDTGSSNTDNLTNKTSASVIGTADSGSTVRIYRGTTELGAATATGGNYSVSTWPLIEGSNTIHATATDAAGNTATSAGSLTITVDTIAPSPAPTTPDLATADDTGASNTDNITNKTTAVTVSGTAGAEATVTIYRGTTELVTGTATGGNYSISIPLGEGDNLIHAAVSDLAGNVATSGTLTIKRDTTAPTVTRVELQNGQTQGTADRGDTVEVQFSEQMDATKVCPTWSNGSNQTLAGQQGNSSWVTVTITNGAGANSNDTLTASASSQSGCPGLTVGSVALGRNYVASTTLFTGTGSNVSSVSLTTNGLLTVKLGSVTGSLQTGVTAAVPVYTPPSGMTDLAGNSLSTTPFNGTNSGF